MTELEVPRSMPTIGSLKKTYRNNNLQGRPSGGQNTIVPALELPAKRPHPTVRRTQELPDHVLAISHRARMRRSPHFGGRADALRVRLLLEVRAEPREPHRQRQHHVEQGHAGQRVLAK